MKQICEKCGEKVEDLWLLNMKRRDGSEKEMWVCENCMRKNLKNFEKILKMVPDEN